MSANNQLSKKAVKLTDLLSTGLSVQPQSVVDIQVSNFQDKLSTMKIKCEKEARVLEKSISGIDIKQAELVKSAVKSDAPCGDQAVSALKALGYNYEFTVMPGSVDFDKGVINYQYQLIQTGDKINYAHYNPPAIARTLDIPREIKTLQTERRKLTADLATVNDALREIAKAFGRLPEVERRARATIAKHILTQVEGGEQLITDIENNVEMTGLDELTRMVSRI